ncbi:sirohydrochlorin chelatase [Streptomyces sp. FIT100]|uniref:sirohydrochlorin chelatase n=1 Tax=Streptomyces sp. FIT100 TaxID=2837956 RepID=UPI0021C8432D|nr:sirohydrochlorin chelatase [Streptomyces sp. FIT100]UUN26774.1 sirohydrochlorin chelatase [Streptomyces sp. FIT100]
MTESAHPHESLAPNQLPLDTTSQLLTRITAQLGAQLSHVQLNGVRRPMSSPRTCPAAGPPIPGSGALAAPGLAPAPAPGPALVAVAHGSRDPRALRTVHRLLDRVRELRPGLDVRLGHIELDEPLLPDALAALGDREAVLVPLLLGRGYHVKRDIPGAVAAAPRPDARIAPPLGPHPLLVEALYARLAEAGWRDTDDGSRSAGVVLAAAGSRDPESAADARRTAVMLSERLGGVPVVPAYASGVSPTVPEALRALAARGRHRIAVASYFTAPGRFASAAAAAAPWAAAAPLGAHPAMARLVLQRYDEAAGTPSGANRRLLVTA